MLSRNLKYLFVFLILLMPTFALDGWNYHKILTITSNKAVSDYQVKITLNDGNFDDWNEVNNQCSDIRITKESDPNTPLAYYIEKCDLEGHEIILWIKTDLVAGDNNFLLWYGNIHAEDEGDPNTVFDFYDDFERDNIDITKWKVIQGTASINKGRLVIPDTSGTRLLIESRQQFTYPLIYEASVKITSDGLNSNHFFSLREPGSWNNRAGDIFAYYTKLYFETWKDGNHQDKTAQIPSINVDHFYKMEWLSGKSSVYLDGSKIFEDTNYVAEVPQVIVFYAGVGSGESLVDWVRIRKYSDANIQYSISDPPQDNMPPQATIIEPLDGQVFTIDNNITVRFKAVDQEDEQFHITAYLNGTVFYDDTTYSNNTVVERILQNLNNSYYELKVVAVDSGNLNDTAIIHFKVELEQDNNTNDNENNTGNGYQKFYMMKVNISSSSEINLPIVHLSIIQSNNTNENCSDVEILSNYTLVDILRYYDEHDLIYSTFDNESSDFLYDSFHRNKKALRTNHSYYVFNDHNTSELAFYYKAHYDDLPIGSTTAIQKFNMFIFGSRLTYMPLQDKDYRIYLECKTTSQSIPSDLKCDLYLETHDNKITLLSKTLDNSGSYHYRKIEYEGTININIQENKTTIFPDINLKFYKYDGSTYFVGYQTTIDTPIVVGTKVDTNNIYFGTHSIFHYYNEIARVSPFMYNKKFYKNKDWFKIKRFPDELIIFDNRKLPYKITCDGNNMDIYLRLPFVENKTVVYIYYGNHSYEHTEMPDYVFDLYDDFNAGSLNISKWGFQYDYGGSIQIMDDAGGYVLESIDYNKDNKAYASIRTLDKFYNPYIYIENTISCIFPMNVSTLDVINASAFKICQITADVCNIDNIQICGGDFNNTKYIYFKNDNYDFLTFKLEQQTLGSSILDENNYKAYSNIYNIWILEGFEKVASYQYDGIEYVVNNYGDTEGNFSKNLLDEEEEIDIDINSSTSFSDYLEQIQEQTDNPFILVLSLPAYFFIKAFNTNFSQALVLTGIMITAGVVARFGWVGGMFSVLVLSMLGNFSYVSSILSILGILAGINIGDRYV